MPVGVQLVARRHADERLLEVALWVEQRLGEGERPMNGPERLTATEAVAQLTAGTLTAEALTRACLERARAGAEIKAWTWLDPEQALAQARAVDRAGRTGLLAGVPVGIKDIIDTVDMPTGHGSPIYRGNRPFADAACVALIRAAVGRHPRQDRDDRVRQPPSRARPSIRTTPRTRPAARRAARPPRSPISRCRWRSAPRPAAR